MAASTNSDVIDYYTADVVSAQDYYPFGMMMPERKFSVEGYRYGFNGKEKDSDLNSLTAYDYGFRIYIPAIGKFLSVDPLFKTYPFYTPYQFASNNPIIAIDVDGLESSNDKNPTSQQALPVPPATPQINPTQVKQYDASSWWSPLTKVIPSSGVVEHSHANTIQDIYTNTGGDAMFNKNSSTIDKMNANLTTVSPGSIIQNPQSPRAVTNLNSAYYSGSESGSEKAWINLMLGGMIKGTIPENIVFSENGTVSNYLVGSSVYNSMLSQWDAAGRPAENKDIYDFSYGITDQALDVTSNLSFYSMSNFVGSAHGTVLANPNEKTVTITITNVTSVHSGDLMKHFWWHNEEAPFLYRDPASSGPQPYTNFSQTYRLKLNYGDVIQKLDEINKYSRPVY